MVQQMLCVHCGQVLCLLKNPFTLDIFLKLSGSEWRGIRRIKDICILNYLYLLKRYRIWHYTARLIPKNSLIRCKKNLLLQIIKLILMKYIKTCTIQNSGKIAIWRSHNDFLKYQIERFFFSFVPYGEKMLILSPWVNRAITQWF